ncbi:isochorismate synthase [Rhodococcus artemisiae]|uniref:isochorismate synthase n=1 Tax=Rhodococcus artemisiae TaxID=714159 RepID=A0ABU7LC08_9NOCA|nr:isochorismate synthase [Rhodococcus artemisiae]MEE2059078.1 isochorismate synthase [Rhodococcus artemisiae]
MQAPVAVATATDRAGRIAPPSFVLSRPHGTVLAHGVHTRFDSAADAASALRTGRVRTVAGALPFAPDHPAALTAPEVLEHTPTAFTTETPALPTIRISGVMPAEGEHVDRVTTALGLLRADDNTLEKVVLARALTLEAESRIDPEVLLAALVSHDTVGNGFSVDLSAAGAQWFGRHLVGASPEVLIRRRGDLVTAHPLAGSAPRSSDPELDRATAEELRASAKNLGEHTHVVDSLRASLEPLCSELDIPEHPSLTNTRQLWHLGTPVSGILRDPSVTALDLALAVHPTPAICGTPTESARDLINELEGDRGFYAGALGWCDENGDGEWMVTIRCAILEPDGTTLTAHAGGGIVADSDPFDELAETTVKFGTVLDALGVRR